MMRTFFFCFLFMVMAAIASAGKAEAARRHPLAPSYPAHESKNPEPQFSRLLKMVFLGSSLSPSDKEKNKIFLIVLLSAGTLGLMLKWLGAEIHRLWKSFWEILYVVSVLIYGCWIWNLFSGLPLGGSLAQGIKVILMGAFAAAAFTLFDHRISTRKTLAPGYRKCPHCGDPILILAVECSSCRRRV